MTRALSFALAVLSLMVFVALAQKKGGEKVGIKELKIEKIAKDQVAKIEVKLPVKTEPSKGPDAGPAAALEPPAQFVLVKEEGAWKVYDPKEPKQRFLADEALVNTALNAVGDFATSELLANKADKHAELEIDELHGHHVTIHAQDGKKLDIVFGRPIKTGTPTVRAAGAVDVFLAKGRLGATLMKEASAWRKKGMFELKADDIARIATTSASGERWVVESSMPAAAEAGPDGAPPPPPRPEWTLVEPTALPKGFRLDKGQLSRPAALLAGLRAQDFADGATDAQAGFDGPHVVVEIGRKDGTAVVLHVGKEDDKQRVYARVDGDPQVYLLANYSAKQLDRKLDEFRDLLLFSASADDVERATFKGAVGTLVLKRDGQGWKLLEPKTPPADFDLAQVQPAISAALRLRAARLAPGVSPAAAGVASAGTVLEMVLKGGKKQTVRIGAALPLTAEESKPGPDAKVAPEAKEYYATGGVDDLVYVVAAYTKRRYDRPSELFKKISPSQGGPGGMGGGPGGMGGGMGGGPGGSMHGLDSLPPEVRKKLEESMKRGDLPGR